MQKRIHLIDEYRGLALLAMLLYHTWYDMASIFMYDMPWFFSHPTHIFQQWIGMSFIFVSGICCSLSKSNLKRGVITFLAAMTMTAVTAIVIPSELIVFGVLHLLGLCSILAFLLSPVIKRNSAKLNLALSVVSLFLFCIFYNLPSGFLNIFGFNIALPQTLYSSKFMFWLGLPNSTFYSADYYPLIPWFFLFLVGMFLSCALKDKWPKCFYKSHIPFLSFIGKHTLIIYLLHQPIIYGVLSLIDMIR